MTSLETTNVTTLVANVSPMINWTLVCNLKDFGKSYQQMHGYLSILVCVFGSITNVLNICVLTTREMRWPTNFILTALAVADLLVMLDYIPFASHFYLDNSRISNKGAYNTYAWAVYLLFHVLFAQVCHFISCSLTVILAIWRYIAITHPQNTNLLSTVTSIPRTLLTIFLTYLWCPLICLPIFMSHQITVTNSTIYTVQITGNFKNVTLLVYAVVLKLVPCILLTLLSVRLISALLETKRRRKLLLNNCGVPLIDMNGKKTTKNKRNLENHRTTRMLLAVLLLFLITEFPQAILGLMAATFGDSFITSCYQPMGDLMDFLALTNSAINFILYCTMSRQFRSAFKEIFQPKFMNRWIPVATLPPEVNGTQVTLV